MFFTILNILTVYLDTSWASDPQGSSISIFPGSHLSALSECPACWLFFDFIGLFSMFFVILNILSVYLDTSSASEPCKCPICPVPIFLWSALGECLVNWLFFDVFRSIFYVFCDSQYPLCVFRYFLCLWALQVFHLSGTHVWLVRSGWVFCQLIIFRCFSVYFLCFLWFSISSLCI